MNQELRTRYQTRYIKMRLPTKLKNSLFYANYLAGNYKEAIWLIGSGRSGTTWVSSLINHQKSYREIFEPFHPQQVKGMEWMTPHLYMRAGEKNNKLEAACGDIFSGKFTNKRADAHNQKIFHRGILIKDIFANLLSYWAYNKFNHIRPIILLRNPFQVALSKKKRSHWYWETDPMNLMRQPQLYEDYLYQFDKIILETVKKNDYILNQILIWSIINYVPLKQFNKDEIYVALYEKIVMDPNKEISRILGFATSKSCNVIISENLISTPSAVSEATRLTAKQYQDPSNIHEHLSNSQIDYGLKILECFGFSSTYDTATGISTKNVHDFC